MAGPDIRIDALDADGARREQPSLVALLRNVVDDGGSVGFLPPLSEEDAREYWEGVAAAVKGGGRLLWVAREAHRGTPAPSSARSSSISSDGPTAATARS